MVEGHQCHRVAAAHRKLLLNLPFKATSPNGRFVDGAAALTNKPLRRIEVHGKNLFYLFSRHATLATAALLKPPPPPNVTPPAAANDDESGPRTPDAPAKKGKRRGGGKGVKPDVDPALPAPELAPPSDDPLEQDGEVVVVRIHFGMSGRFRVCALPGPEPTPTTRLALVNQEVGLVGQVSAMTVEWGGLGLYRTCVAKLGPDPLREDADKEVLWRSVQRSRKPIGLVLMSQELVAGIGNIYRAEILFKAGVHPAQPASDVTRLQFDRIWYHSVDLLQRGFVTGSILTVDPDEAKILGRPWTRRYIYNHRQCGRCKGPVKSWDMAARTVYMCETCQPLSPDGGDKPEAGGADAEAADAAVGPAPAVLTPARKKEMSAARAARVFVSHCAPDDEADLDPAKMTVTELKAHLSSLSMDTRGKKAELVARLTAVLPALRASKAAGEGSGGDKAGTLPASGVTTAAAAPELPDGADVEPGSASGDELDDDDLAKGVLAQGLAKYTPRGAPAPAASLDIVPGTRQLVEHMATAKEAALEKMAAGENRAVEHVALADDEVEALVGPPAATPSKRRKVSAALGTA